MIPIEERLSQNLIGHWAEVVGEGADHFLVLEELKASKVGHVDEYVIINLNLEMAALLNMQCQIRLLHDQFADKPVPITQCLPDFHSDFSFWLLVGVEFTVIEEEFLVLEEHWDL